MRLVFLGTTGYHPNNRRQTACLMLPECGILLDAGTGIFRARELLMTSQLDIFLTHAHLDHCIGLTFLFDVLYEKGVQRVVVHGEADKLRAVREHLFAELLFPVPPPFDFRPLEGNVAIAQDGQLKHFQIEHPGGSVGFRLDWPGRSLAYVTDTTATSESAYIEHVRGADVLVHECYFPDGWSEWAIKTGHSHTTPVAELARSAGVGRLILVHVNPMDESPDPIGLETARAIFPETIIAQDMLEIEF
jgi:ribonuclease BN (tRNA processing enzyme)